MANYSNLSRREQVLAYLKDHKNGWVDGPNLANEEVGGSEGLKRLRELRADGYRIEQRRHPSPGRDIWQYRLVDSPTVPPGRNVVAPAEPSAGPVIRCPECKVVIPSSAIQSSLLDPSYVRVPCPTHGWVTAHIE